MKNFGGALGVDVTPGSTTPSRGKEKNR